MASTRSQTAASNVPDTSIQQLADEERRIRKERKMLDQEKLIITKEREESNQLRAELDSIKRELETLRSGFNIPLRSQSPTLPNSLDIDNVTTLSLREALDSIPRYTGSNMTALAFSRACRRARDMLPPGAEPTFTRLVTNKLSDRAYAAIEDENPQTIKELCDRLKTIFDPVHNINAYRGELATIYQKNNEHVLDFIRRIKDLRCAILEGSDETDYDEIDDLTLSSFIEGVNSRIRLELMIYRPQSLRDAFDYAIRINKSNERDDARNNVKPFHERDEQFRDYERPRPFPSRPPQFNTYSSPSYPRENARPPRFNTHSSPSYPRENPQRFNSNFPPTQPSPNTMNQKSVRFADNPNSRPPYHPPQRTHNNSPKQCNYTEIRRVHPYPTVTLDSPNLIYMCEFMLDTGAEPNLVKEYAINSLTEINTADRITIRGITPEEIPTLGSVILEIFGKKHKFYVIPNDFSLTVEGIIGSAFLKQGAIISYETNTLIMKDQKPTPKPKVTVPEPGTRTTVRANGSTYAHKETGALAEPLERNNNYETFHENSDDESTFPNTDTVSEINSTIDSPDYTKSISNPRCIELTTMEISTHNDKPCEVSLSQQSKGKHLFHLRKTQTHAKHVKSKTPKPAQNRLNINNDLEVRNNVMARAHSPSIDKHRNIKETLENIIVKHYWPSMRQDIEKYIAGCPSCQIDKLAQPRVSTGIPGRAFEEIRLDLIGPLPTTYERNEFILACQDILTGYTKAYPLITPLETKNALTFNWIIKFGAPKVIITDMGNEHIDPLIKTVIRKFNIIHFRERTQHPIPKHLEQYINKKDWDAWLDLAVFSYNTTTYKSGFTPHELAHGTLSNLSLPYKLPVLKANETYSQYMKDSHFKIREVQPPMNKHRISAKDPSRLGHKREKKDPFRSSEKYMGIRESVSRYIL